jgi:hypothetical protein
MARHSHSFVENYGGIAAYGLDRETDEDTIEFYLQKFSDDDLMRVILKRMTDDDLSDIFEVVSKMLHKYLDDSEYHRLFLKEGDGHGEG